MIELTKAEEQILYLLWQLGEGTVQDVIALIDKEKKPSRTTVSTVIRILESKKAVGHRPKDKRGFIYFPILTKEEYTRQQLSRMVKRYFNNSFASLASFFAKDNNLSIEELDALMDEAKRVMTASTEE
jgi:predicted transcriptional regulator